VATQELNTVIQQMNELESRILVSFRQDQEQDMRVDMSGLAGDYADRQS